MTGGAGLDRFFLGNGAVPEAPGEVLDFTKGADKVIVAGISEVQEFADLILQQTGADTIVKATINGSVKDLGILRNVQANTLTAADFDFVAPTNNAPTVTNISKSGTEDTDITFTVENFTSAFTDIDSDSLTKIKISSLPANGTLKLDGTAVTANQEIVVADIAKLVFTPTANFNGNTSFGWNGFDGTVYATTDATVNIAVGAVNNAPTLTNISKSGTEATDITFTVENFTSAFTDIDSDSLTKIKISSLPANGTLKLDGTAVTANQEIVVADIAKLVFTPTANFNGNTSFGWNGFDGTVYATTDATVNIAVGAVNDVSVFAIATAEATEGNAITFTVTRTGDAQTEQKVTVSTAINAGDTASNNDFTSKSENLTFAVGETQKTFIVETNQDSLVEEDETFTVKLNNATNGAVIGSTNGTAKGTINDEDIPLAAITNNNIFTIKGIGEKVRFKATLLESNSSFVNELGVFIVDDAQGRINGIAPGEQGYNQAALNRARSQSQTIFSAIANLPNRFETEIETDNLSRLREFNSGNNLKFFLVKGGTIDSFRAGKISATNIIFADTSTQRITEDDDGFTISWKESSSATVFNSLVVNIQSTDESLTTGTALQGDNQAELIDFQDISGKVKADFSVYREAAFNNEVYFYEVDNAQGLIGSLQANAANRANYLQAAINNIIKDADTGEIIKFAVANQGLFTDSAMIAGGSILAPMIIINGTLSQLTDSNTGNDPQVYFPYLGVNSDGVDHIRLLGDNTFGFEDLPGGGDADYNDVIVRFDFSTVAVA
ncbi:cadherin-like domain-containing protein [Anabaena catenula FACHB-362]|uniref:Cadherin-like domain-containing protein n=2 Tax=Anabaena TaxID=1163 RepID=A0ABR8J4D6_9NOST|nr:cadherin-like domain-containing protein [Anabaena catenula FACHB-362]